MTAQLPISKEQLLADIAHAEEKAATLCGPCADDHARLAGYLRALLAGMEQEPYGYVHKKIYEDTGCCALSNDHEAYRDTEGTHIPIYAAPVVSERPHEFLPKNLDQALMVMGMVLPESREEFNFQSERWIQRLINAVIRMGKQEQPAMISDSDKILSDICDLFKIGELARTRSAIMTNIENAINFAEKLHAIELEFFMVPGEPDDDYPDDEPMDECLVNSWGSTTEQYVEQFRMALKKIAPPAPVAVPDELVHHDKDPEITKAYKIGWNAFRAAMLNGGKS